MLKLRFFSDRFLFGMVTQWIERLTIGSLSLWILTHVKQQSTVKMSIFIQHPKVFYSILQNAVWELNGEKSGWITYFIWLWSNERLQINILRMSNPCDIYGNGGTQIGSRCSTNVKSPPTEKAVLCSVYIRDERLSSLFLSSLCGPKHNVFLNAFLCPF